MANNQGSNSGGGGGGGNFFSYTIAAYLTLFAAPGLYDLTYPYASSFLRGHYGSDADEWAPLVHGFVVILFTFFGLSRTVATLIATVLAAFGRYAWRFGFAA